MAEIIVAKPQRQRNRQERITSLRRALKGPV